MNVVEWISVLFLVMAIICVLGIVYTIGGNYALIGFILFCLFVYRFTKKDFE